MRASVLATLCLLLVAVLPVVAEADPRAHGARGPVSQQFATKSELLADMFATAERVAPVKLTLTEHDQLRAKEETGRAVPLAAYTFYEATRGSEVVGYCLFDDQVGQHEPITFAVQLTADGTLARMEVVVYREERGSEIRSNRFRKQFVGKRLGDSLRLGDGVDAVSGATYSSRAATVVAKRALLLTSLLIARSPSEPIAGGGSE